MCSSLSLLATHGSDMQRHWNASRVDGDVRAGDGIRSFSVARMPLKPEYPPGAHLGRARMENS